MSYLPSKKFAAMLFAVIAVVAGGWFYVSTQDETRSGSAKLHANSVQSLDQDSDSDGLKDWEEILWKTNPQKADSDGDGTRDNDEILAHRDPAIAGPNDELKNLTPTAASSTPFAGVSGDVNITQSLAAQFGSKYLQQKFLSAAAGGNVSTRGLADELLQGIQKSVATVSEKEKAHEEFSRDDFAIAADTPEATRVYINQLGVLLSSDDEIKGSETELMTQALTTQDFSRLGELAPHRDRYIMFAKGMTTISAPPQLFEAHKNLANYFWRLGDTLQKISEFETDPVAGLAALDVYSSEAAGSVEPLKLLIAEIKKREFVFTSTEGGSFFTKYASLP